MNIKEKFFKKFPQLQTETLILHEIKLSDTENIFEIMSDEMTMNYLLDAKHKTIKDTKKMIRFFKKQYDKNKAIHWGVTKKDTNSIVAIIGYNHWDYKKLRQKFMQSLQVSAGTKEYLQRLSTEYLSLDSK